MRYAQWWCSGVMLGRSLWPVPPWPNGKGSLAAKGPAQNGQVGRPEKVAASNADAIGTQSIARERNGICRRRRERPSPVSWADILIVSARKVADLDAPPFRIVHQGGCAVGRTTGCNDVFVHFFRIESLLRCQYSML